MHQNIEKTKENQIKLINLLLLIVSLAVIVYIATLIKEYKHIGVNQQNTIVVQGTGKVEAAPDTAKITISIREVGKTSKEGQDAVAKKWAVAKAKLLALGVEEKDIKNTSFTTYPKYSYSNTTPCVNGYCPNKQVLDGYEVSQTLEIKSKKIEDTGKILEAIASSNITEVSGPELVIDNPDLLKEEARGKAIEEAKEKARKLAAQLDIDLGDIIYFSDDSSSVIMPYARGVDMMKNMSVSAVAPQSVDIPVGQNEIVSNISITYEIR